VEKKNKTILLFFVSLIIISFLLTLSPTASLPKKIALVLSKAPIKLVSLTFVPFRSLVSCNASLKQSRILKEENRQLKASLMQLSELEAENKRLHSLLSFKQETKFSLVVARVIAMDASNLRRSLIIDRGKNQGLEIGNPVISSEGVVGMVIEIGNSVSRIILINDIDFSMAAKIKRSEAIGILSGSQEGICRLKYLNLDEDIKTGDGIVSSGKNSRFPSGIPVGEVTSVSREQSGLTLFAIVKPRVKLSSLEEVLVITNY
jgi:rod shape-determining protein MreC